MPTESASAADQEGAIVVVSFGTTFDDTRKACIEKIENKIRDSFPEYEVRRAFTSKIVIKKLAERNIQVDTLEQALNKLSQEGYKNIIVQTTHLTPGEEYDHKVIAVVKKYEKNQVFDRISVGRPVMVFDGSEGNVDDYAILAEALKSQMPMLQLPGRAVLFMGHGSPHHHNPAYNRLQQSFKAANIHAVIGVVEESDDPNFETALAKLKELKITHVTLMPLLVVAGGHVNHDMAGNEPNSWESRLLKEGFTVDTYMHGLGENENVQDIYVNHVKDVMASNFTEPNR